MLWLMMKGTSGRVGTVSRFLLWGLILPALVGWGCMKHIPYQDDQLATFITRGENVLLPFTTEKGKQAAFYVPPLEHPEMPPGRIVILYPGIYSVALGWLKFIRLEDDPRTGYLLVDYPGRGLSEGRMRPGENYLNAEAALAALAQHFGIDSIRAEMSLLGHSFGSGAALQFALRHDVRRIVLVAPFNTLDRAVALRSRVLAFILFSQIDNVEKVRLLLAKPSPPEITIIHGTRDTVLPVTMGRELAAVDPENILFHEIEDGGHVEILTSQRDLIFKAVLGKSD